MREGALGRAELAPEWYVYTGNACRGLPARLRRHLRTYKGRLWHIDRSLLGTPARVESIAPSGLGECRGNRPTGGKIALKGSGASDCGRGLTAIYVVWASNGR